VVGFLVCLGGGGGGGFGDCTLVLMYHPQQWLGSLS